MAVSGRPEDVCDQRPYSGKAGIGCFGGEALLCSERGHRRASAAAAGDEPRSQCAISMCYLAAGGQLLSWVHSVRTLAV